MSHVTSVPALPRVAALLVVAGAVLWGTTGTSQAVGPPAAGSLAVGATRLVFGGALMAGWATLSGHRRGVGRPVTHTGAWVSGAAGAVGVAAYQLSFFAAVSTAGVALGTAVAIGSSPVFTGLFEWALLRRAPQRRWWLATSVAAVGVTLLAGPSDLVGSGVILALTAGASYATYAIASKRLLDSGMSGPMAMATVFGSGALLISPVLLVVDLSWLADPAGLVMLAWLGLGTVLLAYLLFAAGLAALPASSVATLSLAEPLTAALLGIAVLGERPTPVALCGGAVVLLGLLVLVIPGPTCCGAIGALTSHGHVGARSGVGWQRSCPPDTVTSHVDRPSRRDDTAAMTDALDLLRERGFVQDVTDPEGLREAFQNGPVTFYYGMDPTAPSLHAGNLIGLMVMGWLQRMGHRPIALAGGGTGRIGDPSGKDDERQLLDEATLQANLAGIRTQASQFVDLDSGVVVDNWDWLRQLDLMGFLRDVGKHVSVNQMIARDSVKRRLQGRDQGISFTEFSYQLLQAYDFTHLYAAEGCVLQIGGSDQWGNITAGIDLVRRLHDGQAHGLVWPLLTTAGGAKFGKSAGNAVWLDARLTSPYAYYQYWINAADDDVERFLLLFTFLPRPQITQLMARHGEAPHLRIAQQQLAREATLICHGESGLAEAIRATDVLFGDEPFSGLSEAVLADAFDGAPSTDLAPGYQNGQHTVGQLLMAVGAAKSGGEARRLISQGGVRVNNVRIEDPSGAVTRADFATDRTVVVRIGKKRYFLGRIA